MNQSVERLKIEGFKITSRNQEAVYMSKGADHRVAKALIDRYSFLVHYGVRVCQK